MNEVPFILTEDELKPRNDQERRSIEAVLLMLRHTEDCDRFDMKMQNHGREIETPGRMYSRGVVSMGRSVTITRMMSEPKPGVLQPGERLGRKV